MIYQKRTIWVDGEVQEDSYAEFVGDFQSAPEGRVFLRVAADGHFVVYLNDEMVHFGAAADYPWYKMYHQVEITEYCKGDTHLRILVWYPGRDSQTYIKDTPGLFFEIAQNGVVLLESSADILSRPCVNYKNGYSKIITVQMGFSFYYDSTIENTLPFKKSVESDTAKEFHRRKTGYLQLGERTPIQCMETEDGYLIDMQEEIVGFLELEVESDTEQEILISYGEHLVDGQVQRIIGERDFSVEYKAKKGANLYLNPFRRLAGRYLQVYCDKALRVKYIGLRPTDRTVKEVPRKCDDERFQKIYDVSVNTLKKCMHEHYEDCPWREQAMYTLDSRNQMLCGYYAFDDVEYMKENLLFIGRGQREDGLLSLCFPAGNDIPIPFFSLVYMMQLADYLEHTNDKETVMSLKPVVDRIAETFRNRIDDNGLIPNFSSPCWNFYEWAEGSANEQDMSRTPDTPVELQYDLILNCMYVLFGRLYHRIYGGDEADNRVLQAIQDTFYHPQKGLYKLSTKGEAYSQLGNSFAILVGLGDEELAKRIISDEGLVEVTLSMNTFYYDALLTFGEEYKEFILQDMRKKYGYMLDEGATTFWETAKGWRDFGDAGSLCHGWSAVPVYYLAKLGQLR